MHPLFTRCSPIGPATPSQEKSGHQYETSLRLTWNISAAGGPTASRLFLHVFGGFRNNQTMKINTASVCAGAICRQEPSVVDCTTADSAQTRSVRP